MGKINSRSKGCRHEREVAKLLTELFGVEARRGQQFSGIGESPDVVHGIPFMHVEAKHVEKLNIWKAMEQAERDSADGPDIPVVIHRKNGKRNLFTTSLDTLPELVTILSTILKQKDERDVYSEGLPEDGDRPDYAGSDI